MPQININKNNILDASTLMPKIKTADTNIKELIQENIYKEITNQINKNNIKITLNTKKYSKNKLKEDLNHELIDNDMTTYADENLSLIIYYLNMFKEDRPNGFLHSIGNTELTKNKYQIPNERIIYTYEEDIKKPAQDYFNNPSHTKSLKALKLGLIGNLINNTVSDRWQFIIINKTNYQELIKNIQKDVSKNCKNQATIKYAKDLSKIPYDTKETFNGWITNESTKNNESINLYIMKHINLLENQNKATNLPLNMQALYNPIGFNFINVENLTQTNQFQYNKGLREIQNINNKLKNFKFMKLKKIANLRNVAKQKTRQENHHTYKKSKDSVKAKFKSRGFNKKLPSGKQQLKYMKKIINRSMSKLQSDNKYKTSTTTFMRPNRRHPKDTNLKGNIQHVAYRPDIHIYLDTSGSISENQYRTAITLLINISKVLNVNLYFNSFSHQISQPTKINVKGKSIRRIYNEIQSIPKVNGGTEYENVWNMIDQIDILNQKLGKAPRINFIITDFDYRLSSSWIPVQNKASTKKTYYMPLAANQDEYERVKLFATEFTNQMIDKNNLTILSHILM